MKKIHTFLLLSVLLSAATSCEKEETTTIQQCDPTAKAVKTVTNAAGTVYFNTMLMHYVVSVPQPGTYDSVDVGIVCGTLPPALQANGTRVVVSGTFKEYEQAPPPATVAGTTYYYLEVSSIQ